MPEIYVNGSPVSGDRRTVYIGAGATTLGSSNEMLLYEGEYSTASPHDESDGDMTHTPGNAIDATPYTDYTLTYENGDSNSQISYQIFGSNRKNKPPTDPSDMDKANFGWSQIGSTQTIAAGASASVQWTGQYKWLCAIAKSDNNGDASNQFASMVMTNTL